MVIKMEGNKESGQIISGLYEMRWNQKVAILESMTGTVSISRKDFDIMIKQYMESE